jgi:outer membrane protein assembly factor BamB
MSLLRVALAATAALAVAGAVLVACGGGGSSGTTATGTPPPTSHSACSAAAASPVPGTDVTTYKYDLSRSGANLTESVLTPANVSAASFGLLCLLAVDGKVDAQPLYVSGLTLQGSAHNVLYAATENDSVYAFDADSGSVLWQVSLLAGGETPSDPVNCSQIVPQIGITATPVIDRSAGANGTLFVVAMSKSASGYLQRLHALDLASGAELLGGPITIAASYPVSGGSMSFDPEQYAERAALLLSQGTLYLSFTSHCDAPPYSGWVMAYSEKTLAQLAVFNAAPNSGGGGPAIWMAGGGPAADAAGDVYLLTANGGFETTLDAGGFPSGGDYGNSFLKLDGTQLTVVDYFAMSNEETESAADMDLGSGGILLLPDLTDASGSTQYLAVGAGKDGNLYVVNRESLGKFSPSANNIWQELDGALPGGIWSTPAYFNGTLYYGPVSGALTAFTVSNAKLFAGGTTATTFTYPGTAPVVSANGTANAIVWAHENSSPAVLHAYDADNLAHELYNSSQAAGGRDQFGAGNKFINPVVADGRVFVGTQSAVAVFGLLPN